jgi:glycosyltransferase involved in cell wall biosynthesis
LSSTSRNLLNIGFLTPEPHDRACPFIRLKTPLTLLHREKAINYIDVGNLGKGPAHLDLIRRLDILIIQRKMAAILSYRDLMKLVKKPVPKIVYEIDDALTHIPPTNPHYHEYQSLKSRICEYLSCADLVTVPTLYLKELYHSYNKNIALLPNYIHLETWKNLPRPKKENRPHTLLLSGTFTHHPDLSLLEAALIQILNQQYREIRLLLWGIPAKNLSRLPQVKTMEILPDYKQYAAALKDLHADMAIIPLENNPFNLAKSNIKWLEYSVCRIPGIYSNLLPYSGTVRDGETGILAPNSTAGWYQTLEAMLANPGRLEKIRENAYNEVIKNYTLENHAQEWLEAYEKLVPIKNRVLRPLPPAKSKPGDEIAIVWYKKVLSLKSTSSEYIAKACFHLGEIAQRRGNRKWKSYFKKTLQILLEKKNKNDLELYCQASSYKKIGNLENALECFNQVLAKPGRYNLKPGIYFHLGEIYNQLNENARARDMFARCLEILPGHKKARQYLEEIAPAKVFNHDAS